MQKYYSSPVSVSSSSSIRVLSPALVHRSTERDGYREIGLALNRQIDRVRVSYRLTIASDHQRSPSLPYPYPLPSPRFFFLSSVYVAVMIWLAFGYSDPPTIRNVRHPRVFVIRPVIAVWSYPAYVDCAVHIVQWRELQHNTVNHRRIGDDRTM